MKLEEKIQEKAEEQKEDAQKTLDVVVPKMESVVSSVPGMVQEVKAKGDDIREDIVQKVTIETKAVELTVTEFIDEVSNLNFDIHNCIYIMKENDKLTCILYNIPCFSVQLLASMSMSRINIILQ